MRRGITPTGPLTTRHVVSGKVFVPNAGVNDEKSTFRPRRQTSPARRYPQHTSMCLCAFSEKPLQIVHGSRCEPAVCAGRGANEAIRTRPAGKPPGPISGHCTTSGLSELLHKALANSRRLFEEHGRSSGYVANLPPVQSQRASRPIRTICAKAVATLSNVRIFAFLRHGRGKTAPLTGLRCPCPDRRAGRRTRPRP